jgi:Short C-terminal domain
MPGLLRMVGRTAVIAGTATTVSNRVSRRQANKWAQEDQPQQQAYEEPPQQYAPPAEPAAPAESRIDKLTKLGELKAQGVLTEDEFNAEKARILQS